MFVYNGRSSSSSRSDSNEWWDENGVLKIVTIYKIRRDSSCRLFYDTFFYSAKHYIYNI